MSLITWLTGRRDKTIAFLHRITRGDLTLSSREIELATHSAETAAALRALVATLERTITRFGQLGADVAAASRQISARSRVLARGASNQLASSSTTATSVSHIDDSINRVQQNMEELSVNAQQTSGSVIEMSASIAEVSRIADLLAAFVDETASSIEEMTASIKEVAGNTERFSAFATQTARSMSAMNTTIEQIGQSARQSAELATSVRTAASAGREAVSGTAVGMRRIESAVVEAKGLLVDLAQRSDEIGQIIRVIEEIAGQTNLLALNAAIIAAQAGERGRGFGVVADEIRDLSERTSTSTDEIRALITNVQRSITRAADHMTISATRVTEGVSLTTRAEDVLEKILELTAKSTTSISEIARATQDQARGSAEVTSAIEQVTKMLQQTATATQQQSQTSTAIGAQALNVRDTTQQLKRATSEQQTGSRAIGHAMQNIMALVKSVHESAVVLAAESAAIVKAVKVIDQATRDSNAGVGDLNQMANALSHESALLNQELGRFTLPRPVDGGTLTTATILWQQLALDPVYVTAAALGYISRAVHATLLSYGEGAELMPGLADRWELLEQGYLYRLHLRRGVRFHNGRLLEPRDVVASFLRLLSPALRSPSNWILRDIRGAADVIEGRSNKLAGVTIRDAQTIDIALETPIAFFPSLLTMNETSIVPADEAADPKRFRVHPIGAGPFRVEEVVEEKHVTLRRNDQYFTPATPHLDTLRFRLDLRSAHDVAEAFLRGEIDVAHGIPLKTANAMQNDVRYAPYLLTLTQLHTSYLGYDCSTAPFNRVEVRRALSHALDRDRINQRLFDGLGVIAQSLLPPGLPGFDSALRGRAHDTERARALLRDAGYAAGFEIEYRTWDTDEFNNSGVLPLIVEDLAAIGIGVNVTRHSATDARKPLQEPGHGMLFFGNWFADFPDSDNFFYVFFHSESSSVRGSYFNSPELDRQIDEARTTPDLDVRAAIYRRLDRMVVDDAPLVTLFHERFFIAHKPHIRGLRTSLVPPPVRYADVWTEQ